MAENDVDLPVYGPELVPVNICIRWCAISLLGIEEVRRCQVNCISHYLYLLHYPEGRPLIVAQQVTRLTRESY